MQEGEEEELSDAELVELEEEEWGEEELVDAAVNVQLEGGETLTADAGEGTADVAGEQPVPLQSSSVGAGNDDDRDQLAKTASADRVDVLDLPPISDSDEDELGRRDTPSRPDALERDVVHFGPDEISEGEVVDDQAQYADAESADVLSDDDYKFSLEEVESVSIGVPTFCRPGDIPGYFAG